MAKILTSDGKILMRNGRAAVRCPGARTYVASVTLAGFVCVDIGSGRRTAAALRGTWHHPDWYGEEDDCRSWSIPERVVSISGVRQAPCVEVSSLNEVDPADYPDAFTSVATCSFRGVSLRSSAVTPSFVTSIEGGSGEAEDVSQDSGSVLACAGVEDNLSVSASGQLRVRNNLTHDSDPDQGDAGRVRMVATSAIEASCEAVARIHSCGCCRDRMLSMGVSLGGGNSFCLSEIDLTINTRGGALRGTLDVSGSFNASIPTGQVWTRTINAATAAIVVRWRG